ncbi:helix-turn-helix transcriptional regulator [Microbacterium shaanxiense]
MKPHLDMNHHDPDRLDLTRTTDGELVGRTRESSLLQDAVRGLGLADGHDHVLLVSGTAGSGKSMLLGAAIAFAEARGASVLSSHGSQAETTLAFSGLDQIVRPLGSFLDSVDPGLRHALLTALGGSRSGEAPGVQTPDVMTVGSAVLALLAVASRSAPLVVTIDDAHWCDPESLSVLAFVGRRLRTEAVLILLGARSDERLAGFDARVPALLLDPLDDRDAGELLDRQPHPPVGAARVRILEEAEGNPLALVELAAVSVAAAEVMSDAGPLPVPERLEGLYTRRWRQLPAPTRAALLQLAAMDTTDADVALVAGLPAATDDVWRPAEEAALIRRTARKVRFRHPLARSGIYHAADFVERRRAHLALAARLGDEPDRQAWHRAAATSDTDAAIAADLEATSGRALRRGGYAAAASALQRAAELHPDPHESARLLTEAASTATATGDITWVEQLAAATRTLTDDPALLARVAVHSGRLAALTSRHSTSFTRLTADAAAFMAEQPAPALDLVADSAVVAFYSGDDAHRRRVSGLLVHCPPGLQGGWPSVFIDSVLAPHRNRRQVMDALADLPGGTDQAPALLTRAGISAWLIDETPTAVSLFDAAAAHGHPATPLPDPLGGAIAWAYVERGRWDDALAVCARITDLGTAARLDHAVACAATVEAAVLAHRGDTEAARERARDALTSIDPLESRSVYVYARRALAAAAAADGAFDEAFDHLRMTFHGDGSPVHYHASYPGIADLATAAARSGRTAEASLVVDRTARELAGSASPRLAALLDRARGLLLAEEGDPAAEMHLAAAVADRTLAAWPVEWAQAHLQLGEWLRRERRIAEARRPLREAVDTFRALGAHPWTERALAESRAAGVSSPSRSSDVLSALSPQQQEIVRLAADGLTNREIGERLFLSPRTVGSHLYRSFPKLGVSSRSRLRDLLGP